VTLPSGADDPRTSDEATGLPPLEEVEAESSLVVCSWTTGSGLVENPGIGEPVPVRWLHVRGLINNDDNSGVQWGQLHVAVPVDAVMDLAADLVKGTTEPLGG
jgi:hypothetical protein